MSLFESTSKFGIKPLGEKNLEQLTDKQIILISEVNNNIKLKEYENMKSLMGG